MSEPASKHLVCELLAVVPCCAATPAPPLLLPAGTPIQNDLSEFHAVFDLACPGLLGTLASFRKVYEGPIQRGRDADATEKQVCCQQGPHDWLWGLLS